MLQVRHFSLVHNRDLRPLIDDLSFTLTGQERLAVIGEEGDGKSALLKAICDPEALEGWAAWQGSISAEGEHLGYVPQEAPATWAEKPVWELTMGQEALQQRTQAELGALCRSLGMDQELCWRNTTFASLSGGEKVRLRLLYCLCTLPSLLVLDEPGNDLDLEALAMLEELLCGCGLPVLYVSHDETLLRRTATQVLHLESLHGRKNPRWTWVKVPYESYVAQRRQSLDRQEDRWQMEQREERQRQEKLDRIQNAVAHAQEHVSRQNPSEGRLLKKKMKAVKSLEHRYERERGNQTERPSEEYAMDAAFAALPPIPAGRGLLQLELTALMAGDRVLAQGLQLRLRGPDKVLIIGANGGGKTTLLRHIQQRLMERGIRTGWMPQRYEEELPDRLTPIEYLHTDGDKDQLTRIRTTLGAMKFTREETMHPIRDLSGWQKAKVLLLRLLLREPEVLLMDEPTRNLSPLSAPVMREIICSFPGAVVCVTHDRVLMAQWPGRILRLTPEGLQTVDWTEFQG